MLPLRANLLFSMLSPETRSLLSPLLEAIPLPVRTNFFEPEKTPHYAHFITSGMASIVTHMADGEIAEVGLVAHQGVAECLHLLGPGVVYTHCFMQIGGSGLRMRFRDFERLFHQQDDLQRAVLAFVQYQAVVLSQIAACNRLHEVQERLARWLLMVADLIGDLELHLTQEFLAQMLGARRSTVTLVAGNLQRAGMIEYTRGSLRILDRAHLEEAACECYEVSRDALHRFSTTFVLLDV